MNTKRYFIKKQDQFLDLYGQLIDSAEHALPFITMDLAVKGFKRFFFNKIKPQEALEWSVAEVVFDDRV